MLARFDDIAGHDRSLRVLRRSLTSGRMHHSFVFHGPDAVGKRTVAMTLAAALNCTRTGGLGDAAGAPYVSDDACGLCNSCQKVDKGIHPDVVYLTLERTVIPIDAIRQLRQEAAYRPYEGRWRVFIIDPADRLSADAQNALLKTLEEPSSCSCIILITSRLMHLLPTTRSRCQMLPFGSLPVELLAARLAQRHDMAAPDAARAARLAGGRYGAALSLDLPAHDATRAELLEVLGRLSEPGPRAHVLEDVEAFGKDAEEIASRLTLLAGLVRDMMVLSAGAPASALIHQDSAGDLARLADRFTTRLDAIQDRVRLAASDLERNVNRKLLVETLMFDIGSGAAPA